MARDPTMSFLRIEASEPTNNSLAEVQVNTPVSPAARSAMRILSVVFELEQPDPIDPGADLFDRANFQAVLSTDLNRTAIPDLADDGTIAMGRFVSALWGQAAAAGGSIALAGAPVQEVNLRPGVLVGVTTIALYAIGDGLTTAHTARVVIGYTLEVLDPADFFSLVSIQRPL